MNYIILNIHQFFCAIFRRGKNPSEIDQEIDDMKAEVDIATRQLKKKLLYVEQLLEELKSKEERDEGI